MLRIEMTYPALTQVLAGIAFSLALVGFSYALNRGLRSPRFEIQPTRLALFASGVFCLAVLFEALVNPLYEGQFGRKLWEYRILPVHDANVSALAPVVWTAYGIHLYFLFSRMERLTWMSRHPLLHKGLLVGMEAPFLFEVTGNLFFLMMAREFYAYYLPGEVFHLTSLQVIPVYMISMIIGLTLYSLLERLRPGWTLPALFYAGGVGFVALG